MSQAPGWYRDPFHRGQERYWDGRVWTQGTRAGGTDGESPAEPPSAAAGPASTDASTVVPSAVSSSVQRAEAPSFAPLGAPVRPTVAAPEAAPGMWAPPAAGAVGPQHARRDRRGRRLMAGVAAAALVLVAGGVSAALVLGGPGSASAEEAVSNAATQTMNAQSADMSMSLDMSVAGLHASISANGAFDFAHKTGTMTMTMPVDGNQYSLQEILDGSTVYVNIGGLTTGLAPTKPWVSEDISQINGAASGLGTMDPTSMLQELQSIGATVTSLGPTAYEGTSVNEYEATLPASALESAIGKLPVSMQQFGSGVTLPDIKLDIYVTPDNLLKAIQMPSLSFSAAGQTITMNMTMTLSNYGTPVTVTPPPADQVQPLSQLGGGLGNSESTGNTGNSGSGGNSGSSV